MSELKRKSHNVSLLIYHVVFPIKYGKSIIDKDQQESILNICDGIEERYEMKFIEISCDKNHVHFLFFIFFGSIPRPLGRTSSPVRWRFGYLVSLLRGHSFKHYFK